jgi:hypothetical protein
MRRDVGAAFSSIGSHGYSESRPTSSKDWAYCAFIEQLKRVAKQLSSQIEGVFVGTLVCAMFHIILQMSSTAIIS